MLNISMSKVTLTLYINGNKIIGEGDTAGEAADNLAVQIKRSLFDRFMHSPDKMLEYATKPDTKILFNLIDHATESEYKFTIDVGVIDNDNDVLFFGSDDIDIVEDSILNGNTVSHFTFESKHNEELIRFGYTFCPGDKDPVMALFGISDGSNEIVFAHEPTLDKLVQEIANCLKDYLLKNYMNISKS